MPHQLFVPYPPVINGVSVGFSTAPNINKNLKEIDSKSVSSLGPEFFATAYEEPTCDFECPSLNVLLDDIGIDLNLGLFGNGSSTILQYQQAETGGGFDADDVHFTITTPAVLAYIESIKAEQDSTNPAMAKVMVHHLHDGTTAPFLVADSQALTGSIALADKWALGPCYINNAGTRTLIDGLVSVEYVSNIKAKPKRCNGDTVARNIRITERRHEFRLGFENLSRATRLGLSKLTGGIEVYLRHIPASGGRTDDTGSGNNKHIMIKFAEASFIDQEVKSNGVDGEAQTVPTFVKPDGAAITVDITSHIPN